MESAKHRLAFSEKYPHFQEFSTVSARSGDR